MTSAIKVFNKLTPIISRLKDNKLFFKSVLKNYLLAFFILQESLYQTIISLVYKKKVYQMFSLCSSSILTTF
jgi:hypothetical protein